MPPGASGPNGFSSPACLAALLFILNFPSSSSLTDPTTAPIMPLFPVGTGVAPDADSSQMESDPVKRTQSPSAATKIKNRRKRYLDMHPEYFSADLELAGPLALLLLD